MMSVQRDSVDGTDTPRDSIAISEESGVPLAPPKAGRLALLSSRAKIGLAIATVVGLGMVGSTIYAVNSGCSAATATLGACAQASPACQFGWCNCKQIQTDGGTNCQSTEDQDCDDSCKEAGEAYLANCPSGKGDNMEPMMTAGGGGGADLQGYMRNVCSPKCSADWIDSCDDAASCEGAGGTFFQPTWCPSCSGYCQPGCSADNVWQCKDDATCTDAGGDWQENPWGSYCNQACSATNIWSCQTKESCEGAGGTPNDWGGCDPSCNPATSITVVAEGSDGSKSSIEVDAGSTVAAVKDQVTQTTGNPDFTLQAFGQKLEDDADLTKYATGNLWACREADPCEAAGGAWSSNDWGGNCMPKCSSDSKWACNDAESCEGAGGDYQTNDWGGHCQEPCGKTNLWSCGEGDCETAGGEMVTPPWCATCAGNCQPPCSVYNPWSCPDGYPDLENDNGEGVNLSTDETTEETSDEIMADEADGTLPPEPAPEGDGVGDEGDMVTLPHDDFKDAAGEETQATYDGCENDEDCQDDEECMGLNDEGESRRRLDEYTPGKGYCSPKSSDLPIIDGTGDLPGVGGNDGEALLAEEECPPCKGPGGTVSGVGVDGRRRLQDMECPPCDEEEHTPSGDDTAPLPQGDEKDALAAAETMNGDHDHPDDAMNEEQGLPDMPMGEDTAPLPQNDDCTTLTIGSGPVVEQTFAVEPGYTCPTIVNKDNWLGGDTYHDTFAVSQAGDSVSVVRTDTGNTDDGWGMDLKFKCCVTGEMGVPNNGKYGEWKEREGSTVQASTLTITPGQHGEVPALPPNGYLPPPPPPAPVAAPLPTFAVTSGTCTASPDGKCFRSPGYPNRYPDGSRCTITVHGNGGVHATSFNTEAGHYDYLRIDGHDYAGASAGALGTPGVQVLDGSTVTWHTDSSTNGGGFEVCSTALVCGDNGVPNADGSACVCDAGYYGKVVPRLGNGACCDLGPFPAQYTISDCTDAETCGVYSIVEGQCTGGNCDASSPTTCGFAPLYQKPGGVRVLFRWFLQSGQSEWRVGTDEALLDCLSAPYAQSASPSGGAAAMPNDAAYGVWLEREGSTVQASTLTITPVIKINPGAGLALDPCIFMANGARWSIAPCQNGGVCTATTFNHLPSSSGHRRAQATAFSCSCAAGFGGDHCETPEPPSPPPLPPPQYCRDSNNPYCSCAKNGCYCHGGNDATRCRGCLC